jgi:hypothetical protein
MFKELNYQVERPFNVTTPVMNIINPGFLMPESVMLNEETRISLIVPAKPILLHLHWEGGMLLNTRPCEILRNPCSKFAA